MLVFVTIAGVALLLKYTFNISINSHEPCALESFFRTLLKGLKSTFCNTKTSITMNTKPLISPTTAPPVFLIGVLASHILNAALMLCKPFKRVLKNDSKAQGSCELIAFNMCEANTPMRKTGGAVVGLIKGFVFIVMLVLVLQNVDFISKHVWGGNQ
jgi:hypothetical protein